MLDFQNTEMAGVGSNRVGVTSSGIRCLACGPGQQRHPQRSVTDQVPAVYPMIPLSVGDIAMIDLGLEAPRRQQPIQFVGDHHRTVLTSGTANRDSQIAFAFDNVIRDQKE